MSINSIKPQQNNFLGTKTQPPSDLKESLKEAQKDECNQIELCHYCNVKDPQQKICCKQCKRSFCFKCLNELIHDKDIVQKLLSSSEVMSNWVCLVCSKECPCKTCMFEKKEKFATIIERKCILCKSTSNLIKLEDLLSKIKLTEERKEELIEKHNAISNILQNNTKEICKNCFNTNQLVNSFFKAELDNLNPEQQLNNKNDEGGINPVQQLTKDLQKKPVNVIQQQMPPQKPNIMGQGITEASKGSNIPPSLGLNQPNFFNFQPNNVNSSNPIMNNQDINNKNENLLQDNNQMIKNQQLNMLQNQILQQLQNPMQLQQQHHQQQQYQQQPQHQQQQQQQHQQQQQPQIPLNSNQQQIMNGIQPSMFNFLNISNDVLSSMNLPIPSNFQKNDKNTNMPNNNLNNQFMVNNPLLGVIPMLNDLNKEYNKTDDDKKDEAGAINSNSTPKDLSQIYSIIEDFKKQIFAIHYQSQMHKLFIIYVMKTLGQQIEQAANHQLINDYQMGNMMNSNLNNPMMNLPSNTPINPGFPHNLNDIVGKLQFEQPASMGINSNQIPNPNDKNTVNQHQQMNLPLGQGKEMNKMPTMNMLGQPGLPQLGQIPGFPQNMQGMNPNYLEMMKKIGDPNARQHLLPINNVQGVQTGNNQNLQPPQSPNLQNIINSLGKLNPIFQPNTNSLPFNPMPIQNFPPMMGGNKPPTTQGISQIPQNFPQVPQGIPLNYMFLFNPMRDQSNNQQPSIPNDQFMQFMMNSDMKAKEQHEDHNHKNKDN